MPSDRRPAVPAALAVCAAFLMSPWTSAAATDERDAGPHWWPRSLFPAGVQYDYVYRSAVFADGPSGARDSGSPVGHRVLGRLTVARLWPADGPATTGRLLRMHVSGAPIEPREHADSVGIFYPDDACLSRYNFYFIVYLDKFSL